jgi:phage portal protein BeeE
MMEWYPLELTQEEKNFLAFMQEIQVQIACAFALPPLLLEETKNEYASDRHKSSSSPSH